MLFQDRAHAGQLLAKKLLAYKAKKATCVLALPRGGVPVGFEIAQTLNLPLDAMLVRKLGLPGHEELAMGAVAYGGMPVWNDDVLGALRISQDVRSHILERERAELERRNQKYRHNRPLLDLQGQTVILVDDGCATGIDMKAAVDSALAQHAAHIVVAVPVMSDTSYALLSTCAHEIVYLDMPEIFFAVGAFYSNFAQTQDEEVIHLLDISRVSRDP